MPRRKKITRKIRHEMIDAKSASLLPTQEFIKAPPTRPTSHRVRLVFAAVLLIGLIALFLTNKGMLVAAVVNGKPIFRWQLSKVLTSRFGAQTLEEMITEQLIAEAARKDGISIPNAEVDTKEQDIVKSLGPNVSVEELLKYQGMSKADFDNQIRLQLTVAQVLGRDVAITEGDVDNYIATSRAMLTSTEEAALRLEARQAILDQKIGEKTQAWLDGLRTNAKILRFL